MKYVKNFKTHRNFNLMYNSHSVKIIDKPYLVFIMPKLYYIEQGQDKTTITRLQLPPYSIFQNQGKTMALPGGPVEDVSLVLFRSDSKHFIRSIEFDENLSQ